MVREENLSNRITNWKIKKSKENRSKREETWNMKKKRTREGGGRHASVGNRGDRRNRWSTRVDHRLVRHDLTRQDTHQARRLGRPDPRRTWSARPGASDLRLRGEQRMGHARVVTLHGARETPIFFPFGLCLLVFRSNFDVDPIIMWIRTCEGNFRFVGIHSVKKTRTREGTNQPSK